MGEKKLETIGVVEGVTWNTLPLVMTDSYFLKNVVTWSKRTFVRRVQEEGFPAFKDGTHYCIYRDHAINSKNSEHHEGALMNKHEAAHARRAKFLPLVRAQIEAGWSFGPACAKAGVPYDTAYTWARKYPEWRELGEMSNLLRRKGGDRG